MIAVQHNTQQDQAYDNFVQSINDRFNALTGPVFETNATGLYSAYLDRFTDPADRQYHTCSCCKQFIERFGALATVNNEGQIVPAVWVAEEAPDHYKKAVDAMARLVRRAELTMPFLSKEPMYGTPVTGEWHHFAIKPAASRVFKASGLKTPFQAASEKREEFGSVCQALGEYNAATVATALQLLKNDTLGNSEAVLGQAQFLADLHAARESVQGSTARRNITFRAVATAPSGFCHPRASMIATLLDDIAAGKTFAQAERAWNDKMHPLRYQRPQAAPTAGAIAAAEKAFEQLGAASSLNRRFATLADLLEKVWEPKLQAKTTPTGGIFASVHPKGEAPAAMSMRAPASVMTWDKFARTVLPAADAIEVFAPHGSIALAAMTTAADPDALPILQWDSTERRNPVSLYVWHGGSPAAQFGLTPGQFHKLSAITLRPSMWFGGTFDHQPQGAILVIEGAKDSKTGAGNALLPSTLKSEFHAMRSVIEAFSRTAEMGGRDDASACGLLIGKGEPSNAHLRVTSAGKTSEYKIDRWD